MSIISDNLKKARKSLNISQDKAALLLKIPRKRLASYEEGRAEPPYALLPRLVDVYGIADWVAFITSANWQPGQHPSPQVSLTERRYTELRKKLKDLADDC